MPTIELLDEETIDKIAAGEVIERPASIVKELVENAIDAGATSITVEIKEGGISFIRVTDNGEGIPKDQIKKAFFRHATSKLRTVTDLETLHSLGFRGEALSSIAAVSQVELMTKTKDELVGNRYVIEGAVEKEFSEVGVPCGTTIIVRNIFFNTPARRKFLKTSLTEGGYISDVCEHLALSSPDIAFKFINAGQMKFNTSGDCDLKEVIYRIYGRDIAKELIPISRQMRGISMNGYLGKPVLNRSNRNFEKFFVNKRYIKSSLLSNAAELGYKQYLMQHKFPFFVLDIDVDTTALDVNVHPTKMEIKFNNEELISDFLESSIEGVLRVNEMMPEVLLQQEAKPVALASRERGPEPFEVIRKSEEINDPNCDDHNKVEHRSTQNIAEQKEQVVARLLGNNEEIPTKLVSNVIKAQDVVYASDPIQLNLFEEKLISEDAMAKYRIVGQVFDTYWMFTYEDKLLIMDQHAAHEKVNYETYLAEFKERRIESQQLFPPMMITLSAAEKAAVMDNIDYFTKSGFELEDFGGNEVKITSIPINLIGLGARDIFLEFAEYLSNGITGLTEDIFVRKLATMGCKAAIKGNQEISRSEAETLIEKLLTLDNPYTCPHGRPTIIRISKEELEKKFKRIVE